MGYGRGRLTFAARERPQTKATAATRAEPPPHITTPREEAKTRAAAVTPSTQKNKSPSPLVPKQEMAGKPKTIIAHLTRGLTHTSSPTADSKGLDREVPCLRHSTEGYAVERSYDKVRRSRTLG